MINSLRIRFLLTILVCIVIAVGVTAVFANRATATEFSQYVANDLTRDQEAIAAIIEEELRARSLAETQVTLDKLSFAYDVPITLVGPNGNMIISAVPEMIEMPVGEVWIEGAPFVVDEQVGIVDHMMPFSVTGVAPVMVDFGGGVFVFEALVDEGGIIAPEAIGEPVFNEFTEVVQVPNFNEIPDAPVPNLFPIVAGTVPTVSYRADQSLFLNAVQRWLLWAGLAAVGITAVVSLTLTSRIVRPVEALTVAARRLEQGERHQRVAVTSRDEIGTLAHAFNAMADGLERQEQLRQQMVTDIAHELRTPLSNIRGYLEALQDGLLDADEAVINSLHEESLLLNHLIDDLQELSLAEAGQLPLHREEVAIAPVIEQAVTSLQPTALRQEVSLEVEVPAEIPPLWADRVRLGQILRNLIQNGIVHTSAGGEVRITAVVTPERCQLTVADSGAGIDPEHLPHIFDRFYRADAARSRHKGGAGLGLAIVKALVELHGGSIMADSVLGKGTTMTITLPWADSH